VKGLNKANKNPGVLIVEDDPESMELLQTLFEKKDYRVVGTAINGKDAFEKYKELRPDLITMDIMMPTVDGRECTKNILEFDSHARIVVVSVLGHEELEALKSLGVKAFIKKPIDIDELFDAIISITVSVVKDAEGKEMGAVGMARAVEGDLVSSDIFIDILRHDMLNPLGLIKNFAELMSEGAPKDLQSQISAIIRNSDRLIELIEDASLLSKIEKMDEIDLDVVEISSLISKSIKSVEPLMKGRRVKVTNKVQQKIVVEANPLLGKVFSNLLSNAVKYSPEGGEVTVDSSLEGDNLIVTFKDNGSGIKDEYKETIFERFKRAKKLGVRGSGIGLTIVRKILSLHNGAVWVEDNPEGGSVFKVRFPIGG
jgi:signal transduction histidine kinase